MAPNKYALGPKAVIAIGIIQKTLSPFVKEEKASMLRYVAVSINAPNLAKKIATVSTLNGKSLLAKKNWKGSARSKTKAGVIAKLKNKKSLATARA